MKTPFETKIDAIANSRWREGSTIETFYRAGYRLLRADIDEEEVIEILKALYDAAANEFGVRSLRPLRAGFQGEGTLGPDKD